MKAGFVLGLIGGCCLSFLVVGIHQATTFRLQAIHLDAPTAWAQGFTSETGIPFLRIDGRAGNRTRVDHVAMVGVRRPRTWFEELGFIVEAPGELNAEVIFDSRSILKQNSVQSAWYMTHPKAALVYFYYLPDVGALNCPGGLTPSYED